MRVEPSFESRERIAVYAGWVFAMDTNGIVNNITSCCNIIVVGFEIHEIRSISCARSRSFGFFNHRISFVRLNWRQNKNYKLYKWHRTKITTITATESYNVLSIKYYSQQNTSDIILLWRINARRPCTNEQDADKSAVSPNRSSLESLLLS